MKSGGLVFRNHPLDYRIDLVRHQGHPESPVIVVQEQMRYAEAGGKDLPRATRVAGNALSYCKPLHVSVKGEPWTGSPGRGAVGCHQLVCDPERIGWHNYRRGPTARTAAAGSIARR